jgi:hypothetical protein
VSQRYELRECGNGHCSTITRRCFRHGSENGIANARLDGVGSDRQLRIARVALTLHDLARTLEGRFSPYHGRGNAFEGDSFSLSFSDLALEQRDRNADLPRPGERRVDPILRCLDLRNGEVGACHGYEGHRRDHNLHMSSQGRRVPFHHPRLIEERRVDDDWVTWRSCKAEARASRALSTRIFNALTDASSISAIVS